MADDSCAIVKKLKTYHYNFIGSPEIISGFLAHEVQEAGLRQAVVGEKDALDEGGNPIYQRLKPLELIPTMWTTLKDCLLRIETLESKVNSLMGKK